jgi:thiol-disulfide isomerase/thioredoxin
MGSATSRSRGNETTAARIVQSVTAGLIVCAAVLAAAGVYGLIWRGRRGGLRQVRAGRRADALTQAQLGQALGSRATLVQFSSGLCAPCHATRRILADVAAAADGVTHVEIDAESRLDLVKSLGILATPTVLLLGKDGTILRRATGQPRKADVVSALGDIVAG